MELKQIETFLQIVADKNMSKAAEALYITQSTVSYRLRTLEDELETVLIARKKGTQNITLTPQGESFVPLAQDWLELYHKTQAFCGKGEALRLRIAAPESINYLLRDAYRCLRQQEAQISLAVQTVGSEQIIQVLNQKAADIGFSYIPTSSAGMQVEQIGSFPVVLVERGTRRPSYPYISPQDLDIRHAVMVTGIGMENPNAAVYYKAWFPNSRVFRLQLDSTLMLQSNMMDGDWCILPELGLERLMDIPDVHVYRFPEPVPQLPYYVMHPQKLDKRIATILKKYF